MSALVRTTIGQAIILLLCATLASCQSPVPNVSLVDNSSTMVATSSTTTATISPSTTQLFLSSDKPPPSDPTAATSSKTTDISPSTTQPSSSSDTPTLSARTVATSSTMTNISPSTTQPSSSSNTPTSSNPMVATSSTTTSPSSTQPSSSSDTPTPSNTMLTRTPTPTPTPMQMPYVNLEKSMLIAYDCDTGAQLPSDGPDTSFKAAYNDSRVRANTVNTQRNPDIERRSVIGPDERLCVANGAQRRFPYCSVGLIPGCAAFFISPRHALTAAHCLFHTTLRTWRGRVPCMQRALNCRNPEDNHLCDVVYVPRGYTDPGTLEERRHYDYALIRYSNPSPCHMSFGFIDAWPGLGLSVVGYPRRPRQPPNVCTCAGNRRRGKMCYGYSGNSVAADEWFLDYQSDTLGGNSGSPMYASDLNIQPPSLQVVYGIHTRGVSQQGGRPDRNRGVRITKHLWHQLVERMRRDGEDVLA